MSSYIALELKVIEVLAPQAARASAVHEDRVIAGLVRLYHRCWSLKGDRVTRLQLAGLFGGEGLDDLVTALVEVGLLEAGTAEWRVRGADRYLRLHEARSKGGKAAAGNLKRGSKRSEGQPGGQPETQPEHPPGTAPAAPRLEPGSSPGSFPALAPSTEHRTPIEKTVRTARFERKLPIVESTDDPEPGPVASGPVVWELPTKPPADWLGEDFFAWAQVQRQGEGLIGERTVPRGLGRWWATARMMVTTEALQAAWTRFSRDLHWAGATPPYPFAGFIRQWDRFVPPVPVSRSAPRVDGDVWAELRGLALELPDGGFIATQLEQLRWRREGARFVGVTEDGFHARFLTERFGPVLGQLGIAVDAPAVGGAA